MDLNKIISTVLKINSFLSKVTSDTKIFSLYY